MDQVVKAVPEQETFIPAQYPGKCRIYFLEKAIG
jgi:hypothetical protein